MIKKLSISLLLLCLLLLNVFSADIPKVDIPKVDVPKSEQSSAATKQADKLKKLMEKFKKKVELPKPKGPIVAFLPFNYSYTVGETNGIAAMNEIVVAMVISQTFTPTSLKKWADARFKDGEGRDIQYILDKMKTFKVPADFVCHGTIFKSGTQFGLKVSLYPLNADIPPSYYFRTFSSIRDLPNISTQILEEMKNRAFVKKVPLVAKKILINNFDLNYLVYTKSETGEINISPLPFIKLGGMEYKKEDFFNELLLYNFHIGGIFSVYNNNINEYTLNAKYKPTINFDYKINTTFNISKTIKQIKLDVVNNKNEIVFSKTYNFEKLQLTSLYIEMRKWVKDITLTLLSDDELKKAGEVELDRLYSNEDMFLDNYYIGKGIQRDLIVPLTVDNVKTWLGETLLTQKFLTPVSYKETYINVLPYKSGISKTPDNPFRFLVGFNVMAGLYFHPQYNEKQKIIFHNTLTNNYYYFHLGDILNSTSITNNYKFNPSYLVGAGFDFTLEHKYLMLSNELSFMFGQFTNGVIVKVDKDITVDSTTISKLSLEYSLTKYNFVIGTSFLPAVLLLKPDNPLRIYAGCGGYMNIWYNYYDEKITGSGFLGEIEYKLDNKIEKRQSINMIMGVFPEVGVLLKISKFNLRFGLAYYFDIYKNNIFTNSEYSNMENFNTGTLMFKAGFSVYLK